MLDKVTQIKNIKYDRDISYAYASSRLATHWTNHNMPWSEFMQKLSTTVRTKESLLEYNKMSKTEQSDIKDVGGFVGGYLKEGKRRAGQVMNRSMLTLDIDYAAHDMADTLSMFYDFAYCVYSTHKHRAVSPRLRLVVPLKRNVNADEYEAVGRKVADMVGMDYFDDTTYQPHRLMYWPSTSSDAEFFFTYEDLPLLDPDKLLNSYNDWTDTLEWPTSSREENKTKRLADKQGNPEEKPGLVGAFCRAYSIDEAIETFIPDLYDAHSTNRYTYHEGSTAGGLVIYENGKFAYSHHNTDPVSGLLVNSFDLIRIHLYGAQDEDAKEGTPVNRLPSYKAMQTKAQNDEKVKQQLISEKMAAAIEEFDIIDKEDDKWVAQLSIKKDGSVESTIDNAVIILENDSKFKNKIAMNDFSKYLEYVNDKGEKEEWANVDDSRLRYYLEKKYGYTHRANLEDALDIVSDNHKYHPIRDYLKSLKWDGTPRLETVFMRYLGVEDTKLNRAITRKTLTAAVNRVMKPGCKFDYVLTFYGGQGAGKSSIIRKLSEPWFSDSLNKVTGKDAMESIQGVWIVEMAELAAANRSEVEDTKHFVSKVDDYYRVPFYKRPQKFLRQCIFMATTNRMDFLKDDTGNRRFWPLTVDVKKAEMRWSELEREEIDQIWAEAYQFYKNGEKLYLPDELEAEITEKQKSHMQMMPYQEEIESYLEQPITANWYDLDLQARIDWLKDREKHSDVDYGAETERVRVSIKEVWEECINANSFSSVMPPIEASRIRKALNTIEGWEPYAGNAQGKLKFGKETRKAYVRVKEGNKKLI
ncbi:hypothetical protein U9W50_000216 [Staphylococcus pseudintermedius]|nr:hypothetical protein [Staphylococcus pseudintermedius]